MNSYLKIRTILLLTVFTFICKSNYSQELIKDFHVGDNLGSSINLLVSFNNQLFFGARNNGVNNRFWKTDGTLEGTSIVYPFYKSNPGYETFLTVSDAFVFRNKLYLKITNANKTEYWETDGTKEGTKLSNPMGEECTLPTYAGHTDYPEFLRLNNSVFFRCGFDYFKSDGTKISINKNEFNYWDFKAITEWNNHLILVKDNYDLYITDSSPSGVKEITNSEVSLYNNQAIGVDSLIFFSGKSNKTGYGLWCYSEKNDSTFLVKALESYLNRFIAINGKVVFSVGLKTYVSDGTEKGTYPLHSLHIYQVENYRYYINYQNKLFFAAQDGIHGYELWGTDGTLEGTKLVKDINLGDKFSGSAPSGFIEFKGEFYFNASNGVKSGIWKSDGTTDGTVPVLLAGPAKYFTVNNHQLFMVLDDGVHGDELWVTDGTEQGSHLVKDINPNTYMSSSATSILGEINNKLVITTYEKDSSNMVLSDGTTDGTAIYHQAYTRIPAYRLPKIKIRERLFFEGINDVLWSTDGTAEGTTFNEDISKPGNFFKFKDKLFFSATSKYTMLYSSTEDIATAEFFSRAIEPHGFVEYKDHFYFIATDNDHGMEIWKSDGTPEGTGMFIDLAPGMSSSSITLLTVFDDFLFFSFMGETTRVLWYSDGTAEGTKKFLDNDGNEISGSLMSLIQYGLIYKDIESLKKTNINSDELKLFDNKKSDATIIGNRIYYTGSNTSGEYEPWCSDGTIEGTYQITNQNGNISSNPKDFIGIGDKIFFTLFDENYGRELWVTDGTEGNAKLFFDADPGLGSGNPRDFTIYKDELYFLADDGIHGRNLYKITKSVSNGIESQTVYKPQLVIYPNPVKDILRFKKSSQNITCVKIYNLTGMVIQTKIGQSVNFIDTRDLSTGLYIVNIQYENGAETNNKFLKE